MRSASVWPMLCLKLRVTVSLTGPLNVTSRVGPALPPTGDGVLPPGWGLPLGSFGRLAPASSGEGRKYAPLTRWPVWSALASATVSVASAAVERICAVDDAR